MPAASVLITGATGYLGGRLARWYLERSPFDVLLWIRAAEESEFERRRRPLAKELAGFESRIRWSWGDLRERNPFARIDPRRVGSIVHAAAVTRFNVERELAQEVNVDGSVKLMEFAETCPELESFGLLSTVYASGLATGAVHEAPLDRPEAFANHYEWSKWEAERALVHRHPGLPWRVFRVATAIADDEGGRVTQTNAVHSTLKLYFYGLLSLVPGERTTPLYFVTGDFVADAVLALMREPEDHVVYHVCHRRSDSVTLAELTEIAFDRFELDEEFRKSKVLRPLFCDSDSFELLAGGIDSFGGPIVNQALKSVTPYEKQLFREKDFDNRRLAASYSAYRAPDPRELLTNTCDYLVQTRWGRRPVASES
jgi:nucleoside-diphosphate-sugar epimerase